MRMMPFSIFLPKAGTRMVPGTMPSVMTQAMAAKTRGSVMSWLRSVPTAWAAEAAAGVSYVSAPMTDSRSQGSGKPSAFDSAMTPSNMEMAGTTVKTAADMAVRRSTCVLMPSFLARFQARTMNLTDMAMTKIITTATRQYMNVLFGSNKVKTRPSL